MDEDIYIIYLLFQTILTINLSVRKYNSELIYQYQQKIPQTAEYHLPYRNLDYLDNVLLGEIYRESKETYLLWKNWWNTAPPEIKNVIFFDRRLLQLYEEAGKIHNSPHLNEEAFQRFENFMQGQDYQYGDLKRYYRSTDILFQEEILYSATFKNLFKYLPYLPLDSESYQETIIFEIIPFFENFLQRFLDDYQPLVLFS